MGKLIHDFDFSIQYRKGSMNTDIDALSRIHEVNMFNFTKIKHDMYEQLRGKYLDDNYFRQFWVRAECHPQNGSK